MSNPVADAIDTVARRLLHKLADDMYDEWGNFPEIGELDWDEVLERAGSYLPPEPTPESYEDAYDILEARGGETGAGA